MKKSYFFIFVIIALIIMPQITEAQCAMCKAAVESSQGQKNSVANGINKGILYLMAVPYLLLMFVFRKQIIQIWKKFRGKEIISTED